MFALPPNEPDVGDREPLDAGIDGLCEILDADREAVIESLADIIRRRAAFEEARRQFEKGGGRDA
ncbi:hypothetical protein [Methylobacterium brachythecii]|uniref:Uncharacterized protein n=1 Tax=Methylobacterium brachythecii TaxID=1176177 RepID=A0A7W6AMK0_9HYPH|nr:hypothetical protein [Methylobacterium brachythecii]MBB3903974.1 hypothetical protein [Methylobacterium brachythecii]GLS42719.1 hypothetical protein GCM10007884_07040 [Methylobacterium brachythecii]